MPISWMAWRRHLLLWLLPAIVLGLGINLLVVYQASFAGRKQSMDDLATQAAQKLETLKTQRAAVEAFLGRVDAQKAAIDTVYGERFSTESVRFTSFLREVRELARQSGLDPQSFNYPKTELQEEGLVKRNVTFSITGGYEDLRRFINFLELSDQFITLEEIGVASEGQLDLRFSISTLFVAQDTESVPLSALTDPSRREVQVPQGAEQK